MGLVRGFERCSQEQKVSTAVMQSLNQQKEKSNSRDQTGVKDSAQSPGIVLPPVTSSGQPPLDYVPHN